MKISATILILAFLLVPLYALADFSGEYDPANWTVTLSGNPPGGGGSVDESNAPTSITIIGGDNGCTTGDHTCPTDYTITVPADGQISFDWDYTTTDSDGPSWDIFLIINGTVVTQLSDDNGSNSQSGSESVTVTTGDTFGFRVDCVDGMFGAATVVISNFNGPTTIPTLTEWGMIIFALIMSLTAYWFLRRDQVAVTIK
jgi:hypothetical protein